MISKKMRAQSTMDKVINSLICPICKTELSLQEMSLHCKQHHTFDIAKKGYINMLQTQPKTSYSDSLFQQRQNFLQSGLYQIVADEIIKTIVEFGGLESPLIADIGCGEGYYCHQIKQKFATSRVVGLDISKAALQYASNYSTEINWLVADLTRLPFQDQSVNWLINILSPANYQEFARILQDDGYIIKIIPNANYLQEIRTILQQQIYTNTDTIMQIEKHTEIITQKRIKIVAPIAESVRGYLLQMTPLMQNYQGDYSEFEKMTTITIDLQLFVLKPIKRKCSQNEITNN
jgi:Methylase involved in ubiquinone/menaquinone biosynthesis